MLAEMPNATPQPALERMVQRVREAAQPFARLSLDERRALLSKLREGFFRVARASAEAACLAKGIDPQSALAGEEWLGGPMITLRNLRLLEEALSQIAHWGVPRIDPSWLEPLPDGRLSVRGYPTDALDAMLLLETKGYVHLLPGVTAGNLREHQASFYRRPHPGRVCVVLGGGNVNSIPTTDVLYKLFVEGTVCVLKMNPVNAYLGPYIEEAFAAAVERGYLQICYGGADEGSFLVNHPLTDEVHITGSDKSYDAIVYGPPGPEQQARKARGERLLKKEITSELGNISPVLVVPGPYDDKDLAAQAISIAGMVANNASFNCNSAKLLVTPKGWRGRTQLWEGVESALGRAPVREAYYPGAEQRWGDFTRGRTGLKLVGTAKPGQLPYALIPDVDPTNTEDRVFRQEPWCTVLSETGLSGSDPVEFLDNAVRFVNEKVWGTLCAGIIIHPQSLEEPAVKAALDRAVRTLRYGTVAINTWPAAAFGLGTLPWGGHPSTRPEDIQSGSGFVHNTLMLERIEKAVVVGPLRPPLPAFWTPGHKNLRALVEKLVDFERGPSWLKVPGLAAAAMRA